MKKFTEANQQDQITIDLFFDFSLTIKQLLSPKWPSFCVYYNLKQPFCLCFLFYVWIFVWFSFWFNHCGVHFLSRLVQVLFSFFCNHVLYFLVLSQHPFIFIWFLSLNSFLESFLFIPAFVAFLILSFFSSFLPVLFLASFLSIFFAFFYFCLFSPPFLSKFSPDYFFLSFVILNSFFVFVLLSYIHPLCLSFLFFGSLLPYPPRMSQVLRWLIN